MSIKSGTYKTYGNNNKFLHKTTDSDANQQRMNAVKQRIILA